MRAYNRPSGIISVGVGLQSVLIVCFSVTPCTDVNVEERVAGVVMARPYLLTWGSCCDGRSSPMRTAVENILKSIITYNRVSLRTGLTCLSNQNRNLYQIHGQLYIYGTAMPTNPQENTRHDTFYNTTVSACFSKRRILLRSLGQRYATLMSRVCLEKGDTAYESMYLRQHVFPNHCWPCRPTVKGAVPPYLVFSQRRLTQPVGLQIHVSTLLGLSYSRESQS